MPRACAWVSGVCAFSASESGLISNTSADPTRACAVFAQWQAQRHLAAGQHQREPVAPRRVEGAEQRDLRRLVQLLNVIHQQQRAGRGIEVAGRGARKVQRRPLRLAPRGFQQVAAPAAGGP